jgi:hypothetical protein
LISGSLTDFGLAVAWRVVMNLFSLLDKIPYVLLFNKFGAFDVEAPECCVTLNVVVLRDLKVAEATRVLLRTLLS